MATGTDWGRMSPKTSARSILAKSKCIKYINHFCAPSDVRTSNISDTDVTAAVSGTDDKGKKSKVFYGQEPPSGDSTTTECGANYQLLAIMLLK